MQSGKQGGDFATLDTTAATRGCNGAEPSQDMTAADAHPVLPSAPTPTLFCARILYATAGKHNIPLIQSVFVKGIKGRRHHEVQAIKKVRTLHVGTAASVIFATDDQTLILTITLK